MTVKELIKKLSPLNMEATIFVSNSDSKTLNEIVDVLPITDLDTNLTHFFILSEDLGLQYEEESGLEFVNESQIVDGEIVEE